MRLLLLSLTIALSSMQSAFGQAADDYSPAPYVLDFFVQFGNIKGKSASPDELLAKPELMIIVPGQPSNDAPIKIQSFTLSVLRGGIYETLSAGAANSSTVDTVIVEDPITGQQTMELRRNTPVQPDYVVSGSKLLPVQIGQLKTLKPGDKVFIDDIKATGPDGTTRTLGPLLILVK